MSERRRRTTSRLGYQSLLFTLALIAILSVLSGCGPEQTNVGQTNGNSVPVNLNISMPQESAAASTSGSRFWATVQSWLPSFSTAWAATTTDLRTLTVEVTGPDIASPITATQNLSEPTPGDIITFTLDVPVGSNRIFTVFGTDATRRKIFGGQSSPIVLTAGQAASVDITLTGAGVGEASPLTAARRNHTATLLPNGQVLVVGGFGASDILASAELFDPATNRWTKLSTGLTDARASHTATLLQNGQVLVVGGQGVDGVRLASAELFDPKTNSWNYLTSELPSSHLTNRRYNHTATLLQNGQVLVVGGQGVGSVFDTLDSAELFDPKTNSWNYLTSEFPSSRLTNRRSNHTATRLPSGQVLVVGGFGNCEFPDLDSAELFDPKTNSWNYLTSEFPSSRLTDARGFHTATRLPSGQVLVVGGVRNCKFSALDSAELFDPKTNSWNYLTSELPSSHLTDARGFHTTTLLQNGQVLVVGGGFGVGESTSTWASAELFDPTKNRWTKLATGLTDARGFHTATLLRSGQVLVVGGQDRNGSPLASAELFDLSLL